MPDHNDDTASAPDNASGATNPKWHDPEELRDRSKRPETSFEEKRAQTQRVMNSFPSANLEGPLTLAVRAFIARLGPEEALARFCAVPATGPRALSLERVLRVAAGEAEPVFRMAEVVFDDYLRHAPAPRASQAPETFPPAAVQPWMPPVVAPPARVRQPWE